MKIVASVFVLILNAYATDISAAARIDEKAKEALSFCETNGCGTDFCVLISLGCPVTDDETMALLDAKLKNAKKPVLLWIFY